MAAHRAMSLVTVAAVLAIAWYVGQEELTMGIAVAIVGLAGAYARSLLALPAAIGMAFAATHLDGPLAVGIMAFLVPLVLVAAEDAQLGHTLP